MQENFLAQALTRVVLKNTTTLTECGQDEFQCSNQQCLVGNRLCDGKTDCQVHEDEYGCGMWLPLK